MVAVKGSPDCEGQTLSLVEELRRRMRRKMRMRMLGSWRRRRRNFFLLCLGGFGGFSTGEVWEEVELEKEVGG